MGVIAGCFFARMKGGALPGQRGEWDSNGDIHAGIGILLTVGGSTRADKGCVSAVWLTFFARMKGGAFAGKLSSDLCIAEDWEASVDWEYWFVGVSGLDPELIDIGDDWLLSSLLTSGRGTVNLPTCFMGPDMQPECETEMLSASSPIVGEMGVGMSMGIPGVSAAKPAPAPAHIPAPALWVL